MTLSTADVFDGDSAVKKIIENLNEIYPALTPSPQDDLALIMYRAGQRSVVEYLNNLIEDNNV